MWYHSKRNCFVRATSQELDSLSPIMTSFSVFIQAYRSVGTFSSGLETILFNLKPLLSWALGQLS